MVPYKSYSYIQIMLIYSDTCSRSRGHAPYLSTVGVVDCPFHAAADVRQGALMNGTFSDSTDAWQRPT